MKPRNVELLADWTGRGCSVGPPVVVGGFDVADGADGDWGPLCALSWGRGWSGATVERQQRACALEGARRREGEPVHFYVRRLLT